MYNTLSDKIPKAPVVGSMFSAEKQIKHWENSNNHSSFFDKLGSRWCLKVESNFHPEKAEKKWEARIEMSTSMNSKLLVRQKVLCPKGDERSLFFLGDDNLNIRMKTKILSADDIEELKSLYATWVESTKNQIAKSEFFDIKKSMVSKWLEKKMIFG